MDSLSTPTYVQVKRLLYGGPGVKDLEDARERAAHAAEIIQDVLVRRPEEAPMLLDVSRVFKTELAQGVQAVPAVPETEDLASQMAMGVASTAMMLGAFDALLWETTGRIPLPVEAAGPVAATLAEDLNLLRGTVSSPDVRVVKRTCDSVRELVPTLLSEGGRIRALRPYQEMLRGAVTRAWLVGFGDTRLAAAGQKQRRSA